MTRYYNDFVSLRSLLPPVPRARFPSKTWGRCEGQRLDGRQRELDAWLRAAAREFASLSSFAPARRGGQGEVEMPTIDIFYQWLDETQASLGETPREVGRFVHSAPTGLRATAGSMLRSSAPVPSAQWVANSSLIAVAANASVAHDHDALAE